MNKDFYSALIENANYPTSESRLESYGANRGLKYARERFGGDSFVQPSRCVSIGCTGCCKSIQPRTFENWVLPRPMPRRGDYIQSTGIFSICRGAEINTAAAPTLVNVCYDWDLVLSMHLLSEYLINTRTVFPFED